MSRILRDEFLIPDDLRDRLVEIGIPRAKHNFDGLAGFFPREFNVRALNLSAQDLSRVLVHLVGTKIISLPATSGPICSKQVKPGWHACRFYRDSRQLFELVVPYIAEGLKNGEGCLWVLAEKAGLETARAALAASVPNLKACLASGQMEILSHVEWYLDAAGNLKPFEAVAAALIEKQNRAIAKGFKFLRAAGDTGWISGAEESRAFIDYEMKINAAIGATQIAAVCTYCANITADELIGIVTAHQSLAEVPA